MVENELPPTDYFKFGKSMLRVWGLWPRDNLSPKINLLYKIYGLCIISTTLIPYNVCFIMDILGQFKSGGWMEMLPRLSVALAMMLGCVKVVVYVFHTKTIDKFMTVYEGKLFTYKAYDFFKPNQIISKCIWLYNMQVAVCFGLIGILIMTDVDVILKHDVLLDNNTTIRPLPFVNWLPYDFSTSPIYELSFCLTNIWFIVSADIIFVYDTICMGLMIHTAGQMKILRKAMETFHLRVEKEFELIKNKKNNIERKRCALRKSMFRKSAIHHQEIIRNVNDFQKIYSIMVFLQFCISCLMVCFTILIVTNKNSLFSSRITSLIILICSMWELSMYCYFGNEILYESGKLSESIYKCQWEDMDRSTKSSILIMMARARKPMVFTAGRFVPLSLETFIKVLKASYSYYAFLRTVADNK